MYGSSGGEQSGFQSGRIPVDGATTAPAPPPPTSPLSLQPAIAFAQLQTLGQGEGEILYHPKAPVDIGDVLYLRQRSLLGASNAVSEDGVIVQVVSKGTATYQAAASKSLFRLMASVRADELQRSFNEPPEVMDDFMVAKVRVRASILDGKWQSVTGQAVTRNVDIFTIDPSILLTHVTTKVEGLNVHIGDYKEEAVSFFGGGFEKVSLVTGMKGSGKSHLTKGVIVESLQSGVSAVVFDVNDEYDNLPSAALLEPGKNLKFRLDRMHPAALLRAIERLAPMAERTAPLAHLRIPGIINDRKYKERKCADISFLVKQQNLVIPGAGEAVANMRASYERSLEAIGSLNVVMTEGEASEEDKYIDWLKKQAGSTKPKLAEVRSLSATIALTVETGPAVLVVRLGGLPVDVQKIVVMMIVEHIKDLCDRQCARYEKDMESRRHGQKGPVDAPIYPTVYFEEAHMYMEERDIDALIPVIRHIGPNLFFITNTPGALPDSVIRLVDNVFSTRIINHKDVTRVQDCGLADAETVSGFASSLPEYHALVLSGLQGCTHGFPLVFAVRDFGLKPSGVTRSTWEALKRQTE